MAEELRRSQFYVGTSGWRYTNWRGDFYPEGLKHRQELEYLSERMNSVELNGSFYSLQSPSSYLKWRDEAPDNFIFAVKGSRYISHMLKLKNIDQALSNFLASGVLALEDKLGPILWQLPERLPFSEERMREFLSKLPRTTGEAAALSENHDDRLKSGGWTKTGKDKPLRHALEVRHASYEDEAFYSLLREHDVASVVADTAGRFPMLEVETASFSYIRLHGGEELYVSNYGEESLKNWAGRVRNLMGSGSHDVYVYFDNDVKGHAPHNAARLKEIVAAQ